MSVSPRRKAPKPIVLTVPSLPVSPKTKFVFGGPDDVDSPLRRAYAAARLCRTAKLSDWEAGWVAGVMDATGADSLTLDKWFPTVDRLIAEVRDERTTLEAAGLDCDDLQELSNYVEATGQKVVIQ